MNISLTTVSVVLNGKGDQHRISAETQKRIMDAAHSMNYKPNISAKRLRTSGETVKPIVALFWTVDNRTQLVARYLKGIQQALNFYENKFEILIQPYIGSQLYKETSLLTGTRFNGAIIANSTVEDEKFLEESSIAVPTVLYLRNSNKFCSVNVDDYKSGKQIAQLFASKGHSSVAIAMPDISSSAIHQRANGFIEGCAELGLQLKEEHQLRAEYNEEGGYLAAKTIASMEQKPTAVFFLSDQMAIGGLHAFHEMGIGIPEHIEIVGHDDEVASKFSIPSLTTMHLPVEEMAHECLRLMDDLIYNQISTPFAKQADSFLVVRQSCGKASLLQYT